MQRQLQGLTLKLNKYWLLLKCFAFRCKALYACIASYVITLLNLFLFIISLPFIVYSEVFTTLQNIYCFNVRLHWQRMLHIFDAAHIHIIMILFIRLFIKILWICWRLLINKCYHFCVIYNKMYDNNIRAYCLYYITYCYIKFKAIKKPTVNSRLNSKYYCLHKITLN